MSDRASCYSDSWYRRRKQTSDVAQNVRFFAGRGMVVGASEFWREHHHSKRPDAGAGTADDKPEPPGADPPRISLVYAGLCAYTPSSIPGQRRLRSIERARNRAHVKTQDT